MVRLLLLLIIPSLLSAQEASTTYELTPGGWVFMLIAWVGIVVWNILCFRKILRNK
ncbi:MAG: hypothetical protein ACRC9L_03680 [Brevinema sp.]